MLVMLERCAAGAPTTKYIRRTLRFKVSVVVPVATVDLDNEVAGGVAEVEDVSFAHERVRFEPEWQ